MTIENLECPKCHETFKGHGNQRRWWTLDHIKNSHPDDFIRLVKSKECLEYEIEDFKGLEMSLFR